MQILFHWLSTSYIITQQYMIIISTQKKVHKPFPDAIILESQHSNIVRKS